MFNSLPLTKLYIVFSILIMLVGCSSMSFVSMYKLSQLDPLKTDPSQIKIAIKADKAIKVKNGNAHINFEYKSNDGATHINDTFLVEINIQERSTRAIFDKINPTEAVTILSLSEKDAKKLRDNQRIISSNERQGIKGVGSFGIGLSDFCLPNPLPKRDLLINVYLQTHRDDDFFSFLSDIDLKEQTKKIEVEGC